ncbi:DUF2955 domain-containing protein [Vibrio sinensis]|uniref:DUF2955 domain-containing protein n=1 Tax=Vibrio sinensis TaxID=2302434 RepID=A0A3A6QVP2_9VIBR|nr:DUF2955 domain-containing protein [Vibrio sinensis]RJX66217.1 DUF2955 domain-containing protein [Vibrio sinensis]
MFKFDTPSQRNEALRMALTITLCMLIGKLFDFQSPVYFALYPTLIMTKGKDYSWRGFAKTFMPTFIAASIALVISEVFSEHPFVIWTISLLFFDFMRRRATNPAKQGAMLMPTFNWILIVIFSQHTTMDMPTRLHEILIAMVITTFVAKSMIWLFPVKPAGKPRQMIDMPVSFENRYISLALIGGGVAALMIVDLISATFCLVPVIAAAIQTTRTGFLNVVNQRFQTQVGGCAIAIIFSVIMANHQSNIGFYTLGLGLLSFTISAVMAKSQGIARDTHADALLATMLPIQLYITSHQIGLESTFLRAWELSVTLFILWGLYHLTALINNKGSLQESGNNGLSTSHHSQH